ESAFGATPGSSHLRLSTTSKAAVIFFFYVPLPQGILPPIDLRKVEREIVNLSLTWKDSLREAISAEETLSNRAGIWEKYCDAFPDEYQAAHAIHDCARDIAVMETLSAEHPLEVAVFSRSDSANGFFDLVVYQLNNEIMLSQALPILENAGLYVLNEKSTRIQPMKGAPIYIHRFVSRPRENIYLDMEAFYKFLSPGLVEVFLGRSENDALNALLLNSNLDIRAVSLLRAYCAYLWQISKFASRSVIANTLAWTPSVASQLWNLFEIKFNPNFGDTLESRQRRFTAASKHFLDSLKDVPDITRDRILRILLNLLNATVRTNFYSSNGTIALKIKSGEVEILPEPVPYFEVFVKALEFEGIHLRTGPVARGGIRWSDRREDYRNEILGLVKTQKIKNALIVPTGAKGGFVVYDSKDDPSELRHHVEHCYKGFIRALLSLTDNRIKDAIISPPEMVIYDQPDPYFVVAADKGTATFSDTANKIATKEFNFWLGDAFASGGSNGYDHKLYGITARGTWESVKRHFHDFGIDYINNSFSVVGIGDMSGDVFGNGLLQSDKIRLLAAFNHRHIFIDPNPNPEKSFKDRKTLFETPGSSWSDYPSAKISKGGGVFERGAKEIRLSAEARAALGISDDAPEVFNGDQLVSAILRAPCDLLWNGGIGTYIKSREEAHASVNDGANDVVRIDAQDVRARVIGEGGNLGVTQLARIFLAKNGIGINLDAVDNSGGVDLSDHEVNYKILLSSLINDGKISLDERNELLREMAVEACDMVLDDNKSQALLLTLGSVRSSRRGGYFKSLLRFLARKGYVNRSLENLPDDEELGRRANRRIGLTRPELGIVASAVKMWLKETLLHSELCSHPILSRYLVSYFPKKLRARNEQEILSHPLAKEIIATQVVNRLVDTMGVTFVHRTTLNYSVSPVSVIKHYLAAETILGIPDVRVDLKKLDNPFHNKEFLGYFQLINKALYQACSWMLTSHGEEFPLESLVNFYQSSFNKVISESPAVIGGDFDDNFNKRITNMGNSTLNEDSVRKLSLYADILPVFGMIWGEQISGKALSQVAQAHSLVLDYTMMNRILRDEEEIEAVNQWERELLFRSMGSIRQDVFLIATQILSLDEISEDRVKDELKDRPGIKRLRHFVRENRDEVPPVAAVAVIAQQLHTCVGAE
ncbi:MAG: NAD-glutamate dehydrogenase, partial [Bdellovibrionales bacterium]|nr:NAD-glutamate dehydrogenase [Bdellovibrionales bacterium]